MHANTELLSVHHQYDEDTAAAVAVAEGKTPSMVQLQSWMKTNVCNWELGFDNSLEQQ